MKTLHSLRLLAVAALALAAESVFAAPFAQWYNVPLPDGSTARIWGEGNEYDAHFETEDGRTLVYNSGAGRYEYVERDEATGGLSGIGVFLGDEGANAGRIAALPLHLLDSSEAHRAQVEARWRKRDEALGITRRWEKVKAETARRRELEARRAEGRYDGPIPTSTTVGNVCGFTLLVDFPILDSKGKVVSTTATECGEKQFGQDYMLRLLNEEGWHEGGNYSSVRDFYYEMSMGQLVYTNVCTDWVLAPKPRSYYDNKYRDCGECARELIGDVLNAMKTDANFSTKYLPLLRAATQESGNPSTVKAFNVLFAGGSAAEWDFGLWAHQWYLDNSTASKLTWTSESGKTCRFDFYQITPVCSDPNSSVPVIGTICHEDGHMICGFPDYYHYSSSINEGVGVWSLMCSGNHQDDGRSPTGIDAYSRIQVGWATPIDIAADQGWISVTNSYDCIYRFRNPKNYGEYFLIENRQKTGCDRGLPSGGIQIWRCREGYSNTSASRAPSYFYSGLGTAAVAATNRWSGELSLEQADGKYQIERGWSRGDEADVWYEGNPAQPISAISGSGYTGKWNDNTASCSRWYDGTASGLSLSEFSGNGEVMRVFVGQSSVSMQRVTFNANGGSVSPAFKDYPIGGLYSELPTPTFDGHTFAGWFTSSSGGTQITDSTTVSDASSLTLYAHWRENPSLATALDNSSLEFSTGGDAAWFGQYSTAHDGVDAAQSGSLTDGGTSWMQTTVTGPGTVAFWWRVSSEASYDVLAFLVDEEQNESISGENGDWAKKTVSIPAGQHTLKWSYRKDVSDSKGADCGWVDQVTWTPASATQTVTFNANGGSVSPSSMTYTIGGTYSPLPTPKHPGHTFTGWYSSASGGTQITAATTVTDASTRTLYAHWRENPSLAMALDNDELVFTTGGGDAWFGQTAVTHDTLDAAQSGGISDKQDSWMQTTVAGPGTLSFWWCASCEETYDYVEFLIDGERVDSLSGENVSWARKTVSVPAGQHTLTWNYHKDDSLSKGSDCGWVDQVAWTPDATTQTVTFNANGGSVSPKSKTYSIGGTYSELPTPTWTGYAFAGWFTEASGGAEVTSSTTVSQASSLTLYAHWTPNDYAVALDRQGGEGGSSSVTATYGAALPSIEVPTRIGYDFGGYYSAEDGGGTQYFTASGTSARNWDKASSATLYAKWTPKSYAVTLDRQGGTGGSAGVTATYSRPMPPIEVPSRPNHLFDGYYASPNGSGTQYYAASGSSAHSWDMASGATLYANWKEISSGPLPEAVDCTNLVFTTGGDALWTRVASPSHDGEDAAQSGAIAGSQSSWMQTTVTGPALVTFWWGVSSEADWDQLEFQVDGVPRGAISGENGGWSRRKALLGTGTHTLRWIYSKDSALDAGSDCGWVDQVEIRPYPQRRSYHVTPSLYVGSHANPLDHDDYYEPDGYYGYDWDRFEDGSWVALVWGSGDPSVLQKVLDEAVSGDTIAVWPGCYDPVVVSVDNVAIIAVGSREETFINAKYAGRCVTFDGYSEGSFLSGFTLVQGYTTDCGGGVCGGTLQNCLIGGCDADVDGGGACYSSLTDCRLLGNTAGENGGGAYGGALNRCEVRGNEALSWGGGIDYATATGCLIAGNTAYMGGGADECTLMNCTVVDNMAEYGFGGVWYCTVRNSIVSYNTAPFSSNWGYDSDTTFSYSCTYPVPTGTGNFNLDPRFVDRANGNYHLSNTSKCRDRGNKNLTRAPYDLAGLDRVMGSNIDVGCYEYATGVTPLDPADYDGDGVPDIGFYNPKTSTWFLRRTSDDFVWREKLGFAGITIVPRDYDGDGIRDPAIYNPNSGYWQILQSSTRQLAVKKLGWKGITLVDAADCDGDGCADPIIFNPASKTWQVLRSSDGGTIVVRNFGWAGIKLVCGDYDGDGRAELAFYSPTSGIWYILFWNGTQRSLKLGVSGARIFPLDADFDGTLDPCYFNPATGKWTWRSLVTGEGETVKFGDSTVTPHPFDWDGDGIPDTLGFYSPYRAGFLDLYLEPQGIRQVYMVNF